MNPCLCLALSLFASLHPSLPGTVQPTPRIFIFCGHPGDASYEAVYRERIDRLSTILRENYGVPAGRCKLLFGEQCRAEALAAAIGEASRALTAGESVWMFFFGHCNSTPRGANYNLVGPDVSSAKLGEWMQPLAGKAPLVVFFTTSCSGAFLAPLAGPGRVLVTATQPRREINETFFPDALLDALSDSTIDADGNGFTTVSEIFTAVLPRVRARFAEGGWAETEHALLDGNGDGRGSGDPDSQELSAASAAALMWR